MYKIPTMHGFASLTEKRGDLIRHSKRPGNKYSAVTNPNLGFESREEDKPMNQLESKLYRNREEETRTGRNGRLESFE